MILKHLLVLFVFNIERVFCGYLNISRQDGVNNVHNQKLPRFLTFNTEENGDVEVELEFRVPFLSLPVKRAMDTMHSMGWEGFLLGDLPSANLNLAALGLGGAVIIGSAVAVPVLSALFSKKNKFKPNHEHLFRKRKDDDISRLMATIEQLLEEQNIDTSICLQRILCRLTKSANINLQNGNPSSYDLIISGLSRNSIFNNLIQDTGLQEAIDFAQKDYSCLARFKECNISQKTMHKMVNKVTALFRQNAYF